MDPLPLAISAWPTLATLFLLSQTILLLTFLATHHSQPKTRTLHAIPDAVTPHPPSTQALVAKAHHLVAELHTLLVSIDTHHEAILQLRRQIQLVDQRISNPTSVSPVADPAGLHHPRAGGRNEGVSEDAAGRPRRQLGRPGRRKGPPGTGNPGGESGSQDSEDTAPKPERRRDGRRD